MGLNRITRRLAAVIACLAMLFAALAPSVSHAFANDAWTEICTVGGAKMVKMDAAQDDGAGMKHCPFCATHDTPDALPPGGACAIALVETQGAQPILYLQSTHPLPIWTSAQSRAPPALS